MAMTLQK